MPLLDLTERESADFEPVPAGKYLATVFDAEERKTSGNGKLPADTPMIWVHWKLEKPMFDSEIQVENRRVFSQTVIPPKEIDGEPYKNYKLMNGIIFRLLESIGYAEEELNSGDFELDYDDMKDRQAILTVGRYEYTDPETDEKTPRNDVKGFRPLKEGDEGSGVI